MGTDLVMDSVIVVAFDGLDYELIQKFDLEHIPQKEFGTFDNKTGVNEIKTCELFASFITGELSEKHGVRGMRTYPDSINSKIYNNLIDNTVVDALRNNVRGIQTLVNIIKYEILSIHKEEEMWERKHLECETIFDEIKGSRAINIPSYKPGNYWKTGAWSACMRNGFDSQTLLEMWDNLEHTKRKRDLYQDLDNIGQRPFLMAHFHRSDKHQHAYGDKSLGNYNERKLKKLYLEMDELAGEIKERASRAGYDKVVFMSDHGLPKGFEHNKNCFYSSNFELFENQEPHLTDFYEHIIEIVSSR